MRTADESLGPRWPNLSPKSRWFSHVERRPQARLRLFCLPFAGASAATYRGWSTLLPPFVEVWPVQLPGRGTRMSEPPLGGLVELVEALLPELEPLMDKPFALFGHSLGALVAFELARGITLRRLGGLQHLIVSAHVAPSGPFPGPVLHRLGDREFLDGVRGMGGMSAECARDPELLALALPALRADFRAVETYCYTARKRLSCPITLFCGDADTLVPLELTSAWASETSGPFRRSILPGDHFFIQNHRVGLVRHVEHLLGPIAT